MKSFVLDTNVLLYNSSTIFAFGDNKVVIPITVIEELDKFKSFTDEKGRNARKVSRTLDELRTKGKLSEGVALENGGFLQVVLNNPSRLPLGFDPTNPDNKILALALGEQERNSETCFITKDINARIKADALGLLSADFEANKVNIDELYPGWVSVSLSPQEEDEFAETGFVSLAKPLLPNEFVSVAAHEGLAADELLARYDTDRGGLVALEHQAAAPWGISALNFKQAFALEALLNPKISLVSLVGIAGTGKTLLAVAAGLQKTIDDRSYRRMLVSRPIMPLGRDIGYLPGTKDEKLSQWMQPIFDNLEYIFSNYLDGEVKAEEQLQFLLDSKKIELEALTYIRGRSIPNQYLIIDESQNLTPHEVKTIISRAGEGTKIVMTGDPYQIDNPYLDSSSNGLAFLVERFKGQPCYAHITLDESERSELSALAASLL